MPDDDRAATTRADELVIKDRPPGSGAALPEGTLTQPFFGRQGDEQRQPTKAELRKLVDVGTKLNRGEKA